MSPIRSARTRSRRLLLLLLALLSALLSVLGWVFWPHRQPDMSGFDVSTDDDAPERVLFLGNSFTFVNDLPELVRELAAKDGMRIGVAMHAAGGATLVQHAADRRTRSLLEQHWSAVVLQEQSQLPSMDTDRRIRTFPALRTLRDLSARHGARPVLFATWGYRDGDRANVPGDSYAAMQSRLDAGFVELSAQSGVPLVRVGAAWAAARREHPDWDLWTTDGKHPALEGSYLAACVLYGALFRRSPRGNGFTGGLEEDRARGLQEIAARFAGE